MIRVSSFQAIKLRLSVFVYCSESKYLAQDWDSLPCKTYRVKAMSLNSCRSKIERLTKEKANLEANLAKERNRIARLQGHISSINRSIKVSAGLSAQQSKHQQINSKQKVVAQCQKRVANLESRIADKVLALSRSLKILKRIEAQQWGR
jgi:predicted RNase H-like nuclease (RuvC/YqgF family)